MLENLFVITSATITINRKMADNGHQLMGGLQLAIMHVIDVKLYVTEK